MAERGDVMALVCESRSPLLIEGGNSTTALGIAREIHAGSKRARRPFVVHDCRASSGLNCRRTFLGEVQEASPGRYLKYLGLLEEVRDGLLFLDGVECLPMEIQVLLARVFAEGCFAPLGSHQPLLYRGRTISASRLSIDELAESGFHAGLLRVLSQQRIRLDGGRGIGGRFTLLDTQPGLSSAAGEWIWK